MDWLTWYNGLVKPSSTPAPSTIWMIWQNPGPLYGKGLARVCS